MNAKVSDVMTSNVVTTEPHVSVSRVRSIMAKNHIGALPVVDSQGAPVGIVSATDLIADLNAASPISTVMTDKVYTVSKYDDTSIAARVMKNHKIHRVIVTHERKVVGVVSAFDLLDLVTGHRFVMKNAPTQSTKKKTQRQ
ncbi:MAG: CBS domain-containing protein [Gemmatimonadota bacterium]|nr:CBS domain-containing protein [Gemmatimonadota bacterium]